MWTVIIFRWPIFGPNLVDVPKTLQKWYFRFFEVKKGKENIFGRYYVGQVDVIIWAKLVAT